jgi:hypothetical protein
LIAVLVSFTPHLVKHAVLLRCNLGCRCIGIYPHTRWFELLNREMHPRSKTSELSKDHH